MASGYVTAYGPGLIYGVCGEPGNFNISTKDAGAGGLSLSVEGPSKAEISCHDNKDGTISVSYLPTAPGEYKIGVKFGDKHIRGSPYVAKITGIIDRDRLKNFQIKGKSKRIMKYLSRDLFFLGLKKEIKFPIKRVKSRFKHRRVQYCSLTKR